MMLKKTVLNDIHEELGAKMVDFAGYNMPVYYTNIREEHLNIRENCGVFDVSHMGEFIVRGKEALDLVQKISSNDASKLEIGDAQYSCLTNMSGGVVDDMLVYRLSEDQCSEGEQAFMLVVNASNIEKDWDWISAQNDKEATLINISDHCGLLAVQGPKTVDVLQSLTEVDLSNIGYYTFVKGTFAGIENVLISATGYTGAGGFELYVDNKDLEKLWTAIFEAGKEYKVKPTGLGARDTLRLEMGYCLYGNDIDDSTSPIEAGLGWITKTKIAADFSSKNIFIKQREEGIKRKLVGFTLEGKRVPRKGYKIYGEEENLIGEVTSGTHSPSLDIPIGMGYVEKPFSKSETKILIEMGRKMLPATVVKFPFWKG